MTPASPTTSTFRKFFDSEKSSGILLIACTLIAVSITNSIIGQHYLDFWHTPYLGLSLEQWINDGLMAVFFLLIGLELEREIYTGELSTLKKALLPLFAAIGGMIVPALIYFSLNQGTPTQDGIGIPMATDIAFALGALAILGTRVPLSLKIFVVAFAVLDDLGAIIIIAVFYTEKLSLYHFLSAIVVWLCLLTLNKKYKVMTLLPYLIGGVLLWVLMLKSGIHATIAGVLLAFAIPSSRKKSDRQSPSNRLEHILHKPVAFIILPVFALANTGIIFDGNWLNSLTTSSGLGITAGLVLGKPIGILAASYFAVMLGLCRLPSDMSWMHLTGAGILGGIGYTMSIFITNLAFTGQPEIINASKMAILIASMMAGALGFLCLRFLTRPRNCTQTDLPSR
jgi:NhaA family Na+:H+ antiporter